MELTSQELREIEFRERWRGYDPDDVDDFLERAAVAVDEMQARLREFTERAVAAEERLSESAQTEGALRHTLVLAQRTAESAVAEAQETAARMLREAEERARAIVGEARQEADKAGEEAQRQLRVDITLLETARVQLQADIDALENYLAEERAHVRSSLTELMWRLEERVSGGLSPRPELNNPRVPPPPGAAREPIAPPTIREVPASPATAPEAIQAMSTAEPRLEAVRAGETMRAPRLVYKRAAGDDQAGGHDEDDDAIDAVADDDHVGFARSSERVVASGARDQPPSAAQDSEVIQWPRKNPPADDAFFEALRSALDDDAPLGPRDDLPPVTEPVFDDVAPPEQRGGSRFRRRR